MTPHHLRRYLADEQRRVCRNHFGERPLARYPLRYFHFIQVVKGRIDGRVILLNDRLPLGTVGLLDRLLDLLDRLVARQDTGEREETGLHDRIDAPPHAGFARNVRGIDDIEANVAIENRLLHRRR